MTTPRKRPTDYERARKAFERAHGYAYDASMDHNEYMDWCKEWINGWLAGWAARGRKGKAK